MESKQLSCWGLHCAACLPERVLMKPSRRGELGSWRPGESRLKESRLVLRRPRDSPSCGLPAG